MSAARTITATVGAWLTNSEYYGPDDLNKTPEHAIHSLSFVAHDMTRSGWTRVGDAEITITLVDEKTLIGNKVDSLRNEQQAVRAEAQMKDNELESKIQKLLAIEYTAGAAS